MSATHASLSGTIAGCVTDRFELIHRRVLAVAEQRRTAVALRTPRRDVTFTQLVDGAREIAAALDEAGVAPHARVLIAARDQAIVAAAMLAVLGRGGVIVPIDPIAGGERTARMLAKAQIAAYVVDTEQDARFARDRTPRIVRDELAVARSHPLDARDPDAPCSIYFTSGSTGAPRAILGRAIGIDHHIAWEIAALHLDSTTRGAINHAVSYDAYLPDLLAPICAGGTAYAPPPEVAAEPARFVAWLAGHQITLLHTTPSRWRELLACEEACSLASLRHVVLAGEVVRPSDISASRARLGDQVELWNLYGPTEATLVKLHHRILHSDADRRSVPIGRPMPGVTVHLLDEAGDPVAPGATGQIAIKSRYAAHGYVDEPEVTARKFFTAADGEILYLTGDLGSLAPDGTYLFHGRRDRQLKLYGARVDLDEIETILANSPGVIEAAAVVDRDHTAVFAFVTTDSTPMTAIRTHAAASLSAAMRVARIDRIAELPRTPSGKIDRTALVRSVEGPS